METTMDPDQMLTPKDNWSRSTVFSDSFVLFNNLENPDKLIWCMISINSISPILAWKPLWILIRSFHQKTTDLDLQCFLTHLFLEWQTMSDGFHPSPTYLILLSCQPRVTVTSCFVFIVIRDLESIDQCVLILSTG